MTRPSGCRKLNEIVPPRPLPRRRPVHARGRAAVGMPQPLQRFEHPRAEPLDPPRDGVDADALDVAQADLDRRDAEVVDGAVLEQRVAGERHDHVALDVRGDHRAAAEPGTLQPVEGRAPGDQRADPRRVAEHLVEGDRDEVRLPDREVEPARRYERGAVEDHVPAPLVGRLDPLERMLDAGEVGLRRVGEEVVAARAGVVEVAVEHVAGDAQVGRLERHVRGLHALGAGELADAVDRVVVVEQGQVPALGHERIRLADEPQSTRRVRREDAGVLALGSVEVAQHGSARPLHEHGRGRRRGIDGVRVAVDRLAQDAQVLGELRFRVQAAAGVVEVDVAARVEAPVLGGAELVEHRRLAEGGVRRVERRLRLRLAGRQELRRGRELRRAHGVPVLIGRRTRSQRASGRESRTHRVRRSRRPRPSSPTRA